MVNVASISTSFGTACRSIGASGVEIQVYAESSTSSPGPMPNATIAHIRALVPEFTIKACFTPIFAASARSAFAK